MRWHAALFQALAACACLSMAHAAQREQLVERIDSVSAKMEKHRLVISAKGAVRSGGWKAPMLRVHPSPPGERTLMVEFLAGPPAPDAAVMQVLLPVEASLTLTPRGRVGAVRVVSRTNDLTTQILP